MIDFNFQDSVRQEKQAKERLSREKDVLIAEKFNLEQQLAVSTHYFTICLTVSFKLNF